MKTRNQIYLALLAGSFVVVGGLEAQDRLTTMAAYDNHSGLRYVRTTSADGGVTTRDLLQEHSDACTAARKNVRVAQDEHIVDGTTSRARVKNLRAVANGVCAAYDTLAASIAAAWVVYKEADVAYACRSLNGHCPPTADGGT